MKQLTFGTLGTVILNNSKESIYTAPDIMEKKSQRYICENLYAIIFNTDKPWIYSPESDGTICKIFNGKAQIPKRLRRVSLSPHNQEENIQKYILNNIHDVSKFINELSELVDAIPLSEDKISLLAHSEGIQRNYSDYHQKCIYFISACIAYTLTVDNKLSPKTTSIPNDAALDRKPYNIMTDDPHGRNNCESRSAALQITLECNNNSTHTKTFYHFDNCMDYIQKNNLIITFMNCQFANIHICTYESPDKLILRRILKDDYDAVYIFIQNSEKEFRRKVSWGPRPLHHMALNGLKTGKWIAYGYFTSDNKLIAIIDSKIRLDGDVEIGIMLTAPDYRKQGLASSLLYFFRLKYAANRLYAGTFEENNAMIHTFEKTGFKPNFFYDRTTKQRSNKIRERYHPDYPQNLKYLTNSVYYIADSVLASILRGVIIYDQKYFS